LIVVWGRRLGFKKQKVVALSPNSGIKKHSQVPEMFQTTRLQQSMQTTKSLVPPSLPGIPLISTFPPDAQFYSPKTTDVFK
jgi:hypothetical protein